MNLPSCTACPRLAAFLAESRTRYPGYFCKPVPAFGDARPRLLIVGLAPGLHGANRSGRPFTGDYAGVLLYETLHAFGYANRPVSVAADDGLVLSGCRISNAVKCVPPENKPETSEIKRCNAFLKAELAALPNTTALLALGLIAHKAVLMALGLKQSGYPFGHGVVHILPDGRRLYSSYHCSRYNTQTRRLSPEMFRAVFQRIQEDSPCP
ncbi:MAG: uracil-DNA glycosylase [Pseudomonadota bacterium]|nr:uracil-DNA glycosylase [Pseudomonadota bacterium]MDP1903689.1 uracil-DNA glycosylase [Pseudomonadota bacterium]MDP2354388.1 uracil-DNA glycosylase [Pseudomonadota bacterium]